MLAFFDLTAANESAVWLLITSGVVLLVSGAVLGWWLGRRRSVEVTVSGDERTTVLHLLDDLDSWTQQYSGDLSQHQHLLDALSKAVNAEQEPSLASDHVVALLQKVIRSNNDLKKKLATAENQLDQKSQQIKCYLTQARTDALTGLANRRAFDQELEDLFAQHRRGGRSFVVALIDIDHFKSVNDRYGHAEGDRVLKEFADGLRRELTDALLVARFGGEEFAIILPGPLRQSADRMDRLRERIARARSASSRADVKLTISVGLSEPVDDMGAASIVRRADEALYAAKHTGRNRVYLHDGRDPTLVGAPEVVS